MEGLWRRFAREGQENGVDRRIESESVEREWLTGLFSSLGSDRAGSDALAARMRERRMARLRKALNRAALRRGADG